MSTFSLRSPLHSVSERTRETFRLQIGCLGYNISTQARSRYSSLAAVLGSKTPRQVPAVLKYLLMISVISLQPIFTLLCFVLFLSESTTLCLSPHPKPCPALTGSGTLSVVNINSLATCQDRRRYITGYKRKQRKPNMDYVHLLACILIHVRFSCI